MFTYDWFHGTPFQQQRQEAMNRCVARRFTDVNPADMDGNEDVREFYAELQLRTLIYLRDGFSYEIREIADVETKSHLVFECEPVDEQYKVGAFVVTVPFDEIARVEVFAVHPSEKPDDLPQITGFRHPPESADHKYTEPRSPKR